MPEALILNAYFENTQAGGNIKERNPHYTKLMTALNKAYFPNFLALMDSLVAKQGSDVVEGYFDADGNFNPPAEGKIDILIPGTF